MRVRDRLLRNERGMILFVSLTTLALLVSAGLGVIVSTQSDSRITANLRSATETFYLADAGISWAKEQLSRSTSNPPAPVDSAQSFSTGRFSVSFLSPSRGSALVSRVVVRSTGLSRTSSQVIQARLTKTYDLSDGALSLKGSSRLSFGANPFVISGLDHDPVKGQPIAGAKAVPGISVSSEPALTELRDRLSPQQRSNISGGGTAGLAMSGFLPAAVVTSLGEQLCNDPRALRQPLQANGTWSVTGVTWGTPLSPQIRCLEALPRTAASVELSSSSGAGVLFITNADLVISGAFRWEGLVIVSGENIGFRVLDTENKEIFGAVIVNEHGPPLATARLTLDLQGNIKMLYSRAALGRSAELIPASWLATVYSLLPATITQDYWRQLTL
jgi:hypothetical protein